MKRNNKNALVYSLAVTAAFIVSTAGIYLWVDESMPTSKIYIEQHMAETAKRQKFDLEGAIKAGYVDKEIADYFRESNVAESHRLKFRLFLISGSLYSASILLILLIALRRMSASASQSPGSE